jgi:hypothetical protein
MLDGKKRFASSKEVRPRPVYSMRLLEDANAVQVALMQVLQRLGCGQMDPKTAGLMLYGLQTASANLKNTRFEAEKPTDVVIDRNTVDQTCINGPQWFAREFVDVRKEGAKEAENEAETAGVAAGGEVRGDGDGDEVRRDKVRADRRKRMERAGLDDAPRVGAAGYAGLNAGEVSRRRRGSGQDSCWRRTAGSSPAFGALAE